MPLIRATTTPVPDDVFDRWLPELGDAELRALLYITRRTLGFGKQSDAISLSQFLRGIVGRDGQVLDAGCGVRHRHTLVTALRALEAKGVITARHTRTRHGDAAPTCYALAWNPGEYGASSAGRSPDELLGGSVDEPRWFGHAQKVVRHATHGGAPSEQTRNRGITNRQESSETSVVRPDDEALLRDRPAAPTGDQMWRAICAELQGVLTPENFAAWFGHTYVHGYDAGVLRIATPSVLHRKWLDAKLRARIEGTAQRLGYIEIRIDFMQSA